ncbi:MAG: hypothetical protein IKK17_02985 [Oscillospiraceae bacterium]|nr:hypothetical protein [Oscillospiraceae bacterium]
MAIGDIVNCKHCGKQFVRVKFRQVVCPECEAKSRGRIAQTKDENKKETTSVKNRYSFSVKDYSLSEMERAARANGMTYGRYAAALECGKVAPPVRNGGKG